MISGVGHTQRAISLHRRNGAAIPALGGQVDLTSMLISLSPFAGLLAYAPTEVANWETSTEAYLEDAIDRLADEDDPIARSYLGEAFYNRSRLHQVIGRSAEAAENALAALDIAKATGNQDLEARAFLLLGEVDPEPQEAMNYHAAAADLIQTVRRSIADEQITVAWLGNKQGLFDSQLDYVLGEGRRVMSEEAVCEALVSALEEGRGLTFNRWLGVAKNAELQEVLEALEETPETVLAVYTVARRQIGIMLMAAGQAPRLQYVDLRAADVDDLVERHLAGLSQQGWTRLPIWTSLQEDFVDRATSLVAPLEPYVAEGRSICIVPHRSLHAAGLHTLPTEKGGVPIGLRAPVFSNPSLTNWLNAWRGEDRVRREGERGLRGWGLARWRAGPFRRHWGSCRVPPGRWPHCEAVRWQRGRR